ncbi:MAG: dihydrofolate reductase [Betaproteobacteria bacterium]
MSSGPARISLIAALASNRVIGRQGTLPWHLPDDLRRFKAITMGHPVIMGRRTWESIGRPLPGRRNVVITRQAGYQAAGAEVFADLNGALAAVAGAPEVFVIGGGELYAAALPLAHRLHLTELHQSVEGDAHFPPFDPAHWTQTMRESHTAPGGLRYDFVVYERCG